MPPLNGSPAINAGGTTTLTTDQRGFPRVGVPDIGAAEYQGNADAMRFWRLDFDNDGSPYGVEQALGTNPLVSDIGHPQKLSTPTFNGSGHALLGFGLNPVDPVIGTRWILKRSPDLTPGSFQEIYRFNGLTDTAGPGIVFQRQSRLINITDTASHPRHGFYRFEALLDP